MDWNTFDPDQVTTTRDYDPLPEGDYLAEITESKHKQHPSHGDETTLVFTILDDRYRGRKVFDHLYLDASTETVKNIAQGKLASLFVATGIPKGGPEKETRFFRVPITICIVHTQSKTDLSKIYENVKSIKPAGSVINNQLRQDQKQSQTYDDNATYKTAPWGV